MKTFKLLTPEARLWWTQWFDKTKSRLKWSSKECQNTLRRGKILALRLDENVAYLKAKKKFTPFKKEFVTL